VQIPHVLLLRFHNLEENKLTDAALCISLKYLANHLVTIYKGLVYIYVDGRRQFATSAEWGTTSKVICFYVKYLAGG
jgi:hypothetical protein